MLTLVKEQLQTVMKPEGSPTDSFVSISKARIA